MRKLKFPPYEYIKSLPRYDKETDVYYDYDWTLFETPTNVYGRFSYNEDYSGYIYFDVMEDGYVDHNRLGKALKFNKANYAKICKYAQEVFESFYAELDKDCSDYWDDYDTIEKYFKEN